MYVCIYIYICMYVLCKNTFGVKQPPSSRGTVEPLNREHNIKCKDNLLSIHSIILYTEMLHNSISTQRWSRQQDTAESSISSPP